MSFEENLINGKKQIFIDAVERVSMCIGAITPYVNFDGCDFPKHECAHIHVAENVICVPDYYLKTATHEDLEETAIHEVAHLLNQTHDSDFQKKNVLLKSASWKPPNLSWQSRKHMDDYEKRELYKYMEADLRKWGRVRIDENGEEYILKGRTLFKRLLKDEIPNYIPSEYILKCQKQINEYKNNELSELNEHKDRNREEILQEIEKKKRLINITKAMPYDKEMDMSAKKAQRTIELIKKDILKLEKELKQFESIDTYSKNIASATPKADISRPKEKSFTKETELLIEEEKISEPKSEKSNENHICQYCFKKTSQVYKCTKCSLELCPEHVSNHSCIKTVSSKPESNHISTVEIKTQNIPIKSLNRNSIIIIIILFTVILSYFTINFVLNNSNSQKYDTQSNFSNNEKIVPNPQLTPKNIFDDINEYRKQNKKYNILWSNDAYRLADFRATDMVTRNYFSRITPDGKTVSDYIGKYNFYSTSTWGENLCKGCSDPTQTWIESAGDRGVLLGGWGKGAVACESDICVFIGVNE